MKGKVKRKSAQGIRAGGGERDTENEFRQGEQREGPRNRTRYVRKKKEKQTLCETQRNKGTENDKEPPKGPNPGSLPPKSWQRQRERGRVDLPDPFRPVPHPSNKFTGRGRCVHTHVHPRPVPSDPSGPCGSLLDTPPDRSIWSYLVPTPLSTFGGSQTLIKTGPY